MSYIPGEFPASALRTVASGERLIPGAAAAYAALVHDAKGHGIVVTLASPGAAYRSAQVQTEMREGSLGNVALARKWGLNPNSSVPLAAHPNGTHEHGDRADLLFNGSSNPTPQQIALCEKHGWHREFGANDPNHFAHDGKTDIHYGQAPAVYHTVVSGDTLSGIAAANHLTLTQIEHLNPLIANPDSIKIGQKVRIK